MRAIFACLVTFLLWTATARAAEADALAISANIQARHVPFGTLLDPIYASSTNTQIAGYTRCGDSALWTAAYLAAESFHYKVTQSPEALRNVKSALAGLQQLVDVTGDNRLARCSFPTNSPFGAGIAREEANNGVRQNGSLTWIDNTSRDQVVGAFFGLGVAFDLVDDPAVKSGASDLVTRMIGFVSGHQWSPNDNFTGSFQIRPEELQMLLQVARHVNPANTVEGPALVLPVDTAVAFDLLSNSSYFKFNLDYMTFYQLLGRQDNSNNRNAYLTLRTDTAGHQNPFFNMVDRALRGADLARDVETRTLLDQWLQRPRRDFYVDVSAQVSVCGGDACAPIPVPLRPPATFLWEVSPFQLKGGGQGLIENSGVDYLLPYWMARYYGVIGSESRVQSSAAPGNAVAPGSLASLYGSGLAASPARAGSLPLPLSLGGVTLTITDATGAQRIAPLLYVSPGQINFLLPDNVAPGTPTFTVSGSGAPQSFTGAVQRVAPSLFSMSGTGSGVAAATAVSVQPANPQLQSPVAVFQCGNSGCLSTPIALGIDRPVYLSLYGTGIRNAALSDVIVTVGGIHLPALYAGPAPNFVGLDQVNVVLPLLLRGSGEINVSLTVSGQISNTVTIQVQ